MKMMVSTALRLTINKVGGMHYFASGCSYITHSFLGTIVAGTL